MKRILSILAVSVGICANSYAFEITNYTSSLQFATTDFTHFHNIPLFDSSLGALLQVDIKWILTSTTSFNYENTSQDFILVNTRVSGTNTLQLPGALGFRTNSINLLSSDIALNPFDSSIDFAGTSGFSSNSVTALTNNYSTTLAGDLPAFTQGPGTTNFQVVADYNSGINSFLTETLSSEQLVLTQASSFISITYTYVPEPSTYAAIGGLGLMVAWQLRRRKN